MSEQLVKQILRSKVYDVAKKTPITKAKILSSKLNNQILFKREDMQPVFSFKIRGAYNKIANLTDEEKQKGIVAASAGNHAQGVALAAKRLGIVPVIVMPETTPEIKVNAVKQLGAEVVLHGDVYDEAYEKSQQLANANEYTFIHPYDDELVIAGQGSVGIEIIQQVNDLDAVFIPVGGGGLLAGVAAYIKYVNPEIKVIATEFDESACFKAAFEKKERVKLKQVGLFADGVAVAQMGERPWFFAKDNVDAAVTATSDELCAAIQEVFEDTRSIMEPAGALAVAGMKNYIEQQGWQNKKCLAVLSGANLNFHRLRYISERTEIGEKREAVFGVTIKDIAGSFLTFCKRLGRRNITEFNYRYDGNDEAKLFIALTIENTEERKALVKMLEGDYRIVDLTDDHVAKLHVRYMIGGHLPESTNDELLFSFIFPERPGSLFDFFEQLGQHYNISLFHYRNHGSAYSRVLVGFHAHISEKEKMEALFTSLGYKYVEQTGNPAYQYFLK